MSDKEPPSYAAARAFPRAMGAIGGNDPDGTVWCGLCAWTGHATTNELVEHRIQAHLGEAHGMKAGVRFDHDEQQAVLLP